MKYIFTLFFVVILMTNCYSQNKDREELKKVSNEILTYIKEYSIVTDSINWKEFRRDILTKITKLMTLIQIKLSFLQFWINYDSTEIFILFILISLI